MAPEELVDRERELLVLAKEWMPRLPFRFVDILIIDEIGKDISGSGMDTNVVGRKYFAHVAAEHEYPKVKQIIVRGLTKETHGNASGIGVAEFCTTRLLEQTDVNATRINCLTGGAAFAAMLPLNYDTDRQLLDMVLPAIGLTEPEDSRILWIRNTLQLAEVECSAAYWDESQQRDDLDVISERRDFQFDSDGNFVPFETTATVH